MTTTPLKTQSPRPKPERYVQWLMRPTPEYRFGVARITVGKETAEYFVRELQADFGRGFEVTKLATGQTEAKVYHVNLDVQTGNHSCECDGWLRWQKCKHVHGLLALLATEKNPNTP